MCGVRCRQGSAEEGAPHCVAGTPGIKRRESTVRVHVPRPRTVGVTLGGITEGDTETDRAHDTPARVSGLWGSFLPENSARLGVGPRVSRGVTGAPKDV